MKKHKTSLQPYLDDVTEIDEIFNINHTSEPTTNNLMFMALALCGEAGELANTVKKVVRNGETEGLMGKVAEELADIMIYLCKILKITNINFDAAWTTKHTVLALTRRERLADYVIVDKHLSNWGESYEE